MNTLEKTTATAYICLLKSPLGQMSIGYIENAVVCTKIGHSSKIQTAETLARLGYNLGKDSLPAGEILKKELHEYFEGRRKKFTIRPVFHGTPFQIEAWKALSRIPYGHTLSYGELAVRAGHPNAARAVGRIMGQNRIPIIVPCHRVIAADGSLGGFGYGLDVKRRLLELEGIGIE